MTKYDDKRQAMDLISKAFIEEDGGGQMPPEMQAVYDELQARQLPTHFFVKKHLQRRQLPITKATLVVGYVDTLHTAFKMLKVDPPPTNDYPACLQPFLHRRIWTSTIRELTAQLYDGHPPIFAKPLDHKKRFTGRVFTSHEDLRYLEGASQNLPIWCSELVEWLSEYRVFVTRGEIVGIQSYAGDNKISLNMDVVSKAIHLLEDAGESTAAYAVDFGVMTNGQTAVVEWNDGFALGSYGLAKSLYTDLLITRWHEMMTH